MTEPRQRTFNPDSCHPARRRATCWCTLVFLVLTILLGGCNTPKPFKGPQITITETGGHWQVLQKDDITSIYGIGLSYARHIAETGSTWDPNTPAPVFRKSLNSLNTSQSLIYPDRVAFLSMAETIEPGLARVLDERFPYINPLLDYEVELGMVLLEPFDRTRRNDPDYLPRLGFMLVGDFTARAFMMLGENKPNRNEYWGAAKSFPGFSAIGSKMWVPNTFARDTMLNVAVETWVNGRQRQSGNTTDRVYSTRQIIDFVADQFPDDPLKTGTVIMTGTPPGVAFQAPGWKRALARMLDLNRFTILKMVIEENDDNPDFLVPEDIVSFTLGDYDSLTIRITGQTAAQEAGMATASK